MIAIRRANTRFAPTYISDSCDTSRMCGRHDNDGSWNDYILWAGDIDNDQKLNLILNAPQHYYGPHHSADYRLLTPGF